MRKCPLVPKNDPRFQALTEAYKDEFTDYGLVIALQMCREHYDYSDDWIPETPAQLEVFARYVEHHVHKSKEQIAREKETPRPDPKSERDSLSRLYAMLYGLYTPEQLDARINMLAIDFGTLVDRLEAKDSRHLSRQELIRAQARDGKNGYTVLMERVFSDYERHYTDADVMMAGYEKRHPNATDEEKAYAREAYEYRAEEYRKVLENKERLAALAAARIGENEGFVVRIRDLSVSFENPDEADMQTDGQTGRQDDSGEDREEGSKGDRYGDFRTLRLISTLSSRARRFLNSIERVDSDGDVITDDIGVRQFVEARQAAVVLKRTLANSSPETMMSDLTAAADFHPWIKGLVSRLQDEPDMQSTIYANFKNAETEYVYINPDKGAYRPRISNTSTNGYALAREARDNLRAGYVLDEAHSVYTGYGSLKSQEAIDAIWERFDAIRRRVLFGTRDIRMVDGDKMLSEKAKDILVKRLKDAGMDGEYLRLPPQDAMQAFLDGNPDIPEEVAAMLRGFGFPVSTEDVRTVALQTMTQGGFDYIVGKHMGTASVGRNKLYQLMNPMDGILKYIRRIRKRPNPATGGYLFNADGEDFCSINRCLALAQYREVETRVVNEGKSLSVYNNVNLLHQTIDFLTNRDERPEEQYLADLDEEYLRYEGMSLGFGKWRQVHGWLRLLVENKDRIRDYLRVVDVAAFNHVEYAQLSRTQKLACSLVMYLNWWDDGFAAYEVPIQGDYSTAYNFIVAPKLSYEEVTDALVDEVLIEIERIDSIQHRINDGSRVRLAVYEERGLRFQIFQEFNTDGFLEGYTRQEGPDDARAYVRERVAEQLRKVVDKDMRTLEDAGVLSDRLIRMGSPRDSTDRYFHTDDGLVGSLDEEGRNVLRDYAANVFYAREQMTKLLTGGLEQFNGLIDYEKRNMLLHATRSSLYTMATWNGERVGKDSQNVVYIGDAESRSAFFDDIAELLRQLLDKKVISKAQYEAMLSSYERIKTTDGQGLRTLESYREVMVMADMWDSRHEDAYRRIMASEPGRILFTPDDLGVFMQNIKPVFTGYEHIPAAAGENQKPVRLTVLHKYSEMVLLPTVLAEKCLQCRSVPMQALAGAQEELKRLGKGADLFLFHSGVKVGAHTVLQPFAKDEDGNFILTDAKSIGDYIVSSVLGNESVIHKLRFKYFGMAASTPAHVADDRIAWASQAEKVAWANIAPGDRISAGGAEMDAADARELYYAIKTAGIVEAYKGLREMFRDPYELERVFQEELAGKPYSSRELMFALTSLKDGTFAVPLFSPNVEHQVQELLASIIKKRLTKPRVKGANILQSTGLGMDVEASMFDNHDALSEDEKLHVVFEGAGGSKRIKYVEAYLPIHDSRLRMFADEDGNIGPRRLRELVAQGTIPESMLEFIAYRTPSDAEHSVIPCRIKGFVANVAGATIRLPKEIMVMTGHDYDGDKMRCHFKNFRLADKEGNEIAVSDEEVVRMILGQTPADSKLRKCVVDEYDYGKPPLENSRAARDNARVELMFAELTSPAGSRRMVIPGGCDETKVTAKSLYLVRAARDADARDKIAERLADMGMDSGRARAVVRNAGALYETLARRSDADLTGVVREVSGLESPFTLTHSADAFDYIMGGGEMIGIYALYNSAFQMMQRLDLSYCPRISSKGNPYVVTFFGNTFGKLFSVTNHRGGLASLGLARLLNAAVDNNKDPVLGYLHQTKEMAEMTFLMFAAGMTEEEIHLVMNQPAVVELARRLKGRRSKGMQGEISELIDELTGGNPYFGDLVSGLGQWIGVRNVAKMGRESFARELSTSFGELAGTDDLPAIERQVSLLQTLAHLSPAARNLATFVRLTRPESETGAIGASIANIITKTVALSDFREKLDKEGDNELRIAGMRDVMRRRDVHEGWDPGYIIEEVLGTRLPEVVALNSLMLDTSLDMLKPYFPQAKRSWVELAAEIAEAYSYRTLQEGIVGRVGSEMILWKLLSNKKFITGDPQEEQRRIIIDVPKQLKDLKERIARAELNPGTDSDAEDLSGNVFLRNLSTTTPENSGVAPRIQFRLNGPPIEGMADTIRACWGAMINSPDAGIRQLAVDLFKYNLYTNGFSYGMYEFSHLAPFSVLANTPYYLAALDDVMKSNWDDEDDRENFINQYYMNHWGDRRFIPRVSIGDIAVMKLPAGVTGQLWLARSDRNWDVFSRLDNGLRYVVVTSGENGSVQTLYRVEPGNADARYVLVKAQKLGSRNPHGQITLQYNPTVEYQYVTPVVAGNDSAWGQLDALKPAAASGVNVPVTGRMGAVSLGDILNRGPAGLLGLSFFGLQGAARQAQMREAEEKAEAASAKNDGTLEKAGQGTQTPHAASMPVSDFFGLGVTDSVDLSGAVAGVSTEDNDAPGGEMLNIVRRDEEGKVISEKVPATPGNISLARKQKAFVELNRRLREILRSKGVGVGVLTDIEARLSLGGVADFDTANVTAEGLLEMIRIADGYEGELALPEEFAHMALEMLGHDHVLVARLLNALRGSRESMQEAYDGMYDEYERRYRGNQDKLVLEAAGKLVAKQLFRQQEIRSSPVRTILSRVVDAIRSLLRRFSRDEVQNAIFDANRVASKIAREMLGGRLLDDMSLDNIGSTGQFLQVKNDLTGKEDILSKLLKTESKRLAIFRKRQGYVNRHNPSAAMLATEAQIAKLEAAIRNYKTEDAIVSYMYDSLEFLAVMEKSLDDAVNSGRPMNSICRKLNTVRDTLYSFAKSLDDVRESIVDGEVQDSAGLTQIMDHVAGVLAKFHQKYERLGRIYFEEMLSSVYGEHGKTVEIGKDRGRVISIKEMARKADRDISLASRWFHSIADCNDYVLKAVDDVTRSAKMRARRRAVAVRPRIEVAMAELVKATGSRDQSFMFETKLGSDGKMHRNGKYISAEAAKKLTPARKQFYDTMMAIKKDADRCVPESLVNDRKIVMMRKYTMDRFKDAEGAKGKALEAWEGLKNRVMETGDDIDFDNHEVAVDFEGNRVDMLPVKFLLKGRNESFDDMTDDVATSMMAYAGMAFEYDELNGVIGILENAKYMSSERKVTQRTGSRTQRESIETDTVSFREPFTRKQAQTNIQRALEDFFQMHIYGHIRSNEGTFGRTRISKRKVVDTINAVTSYSQMAINLPQRIANINTGLTQIVVEGLGKRWFAAGDAAWATGIYIKESADRIAETGRTDCHNKLSLWCEHFDVHQNNGRGGAHYKKGWLSRVFNTGLLYAGLTAGEDYLACTTSLSIARNYKVRDAEGKETNLWEAYEVRYSDPVNKRGAYLALKDGYTRLDGSPITFEDEDAYSKKVAGMNFELQGIYNTDDRSALQQYAFGALLLMYRKWIAPALKRRYEGVSYSVLKDSYQEGYYHTLFRTATEVLRDAKDQVTEEQGAEALLNIIEDIKALRTSITMNWNKLTGYEKSNVHKAFAELAVVVGLFIACSLLTKLPPERDDDDRSKLLTWWDRQALSQMLRLRSEIGAQAPTPMLVDEATKILRSPFAALKPIAATLDGLKLLLPTTYMTEVKSGRYKGHSKAYKYFRELPIISMFKKMDNFVDPSPMIQYYKNDTPL